MEQLFELLKMRPLASILVLGAVALLFLILFKELIRSYLIKKFDLHTKAQMQEFAGLYASGYYLDSRTRQPISVSDAYRQYKKDKKL